MIKISVSASKEYDVIIKQGILGTVRDFLMEIGITQDKKLCIVTDSTVDKLYAGQDHILWKNLKNAGFDLYKYVFPGGESTKTLDTIAQLLNFLADNRFSRSDVLIALGGGIVGDVTGFAAASYMRGIEFVQIPTTLLSIVDSSVGGKTGVNLKAGKNLAGAFWQPSLVVFDPNVLSSLSYDILLDGISEAIKAGFIGDKTIIDDINKYMETAPEDIKLLAKDSRFLTNIAAKAINVKKKIVEEDEDEKGSRQLLNLGHTLAHAIEKCSDYKISHGHAVATGMAIVSAAADSLGWSKEKNTPMLLDLLHKFHFPLECPFTPQQLTEAALQDKKIRGGNITLVLPEYVGSCSLKTIPKDMLYTFICSGLKGL